MANPIGDPEAVDALARQFRREAERVEALHADSRRRLEATLWVGQRATRTKTRVDGRNGVINRQSEELRSLARSLEGHAAWMRETIRELQGLERRIRAWATANPPDPTTLTPDASLVTYWPPHCDFGWRALASRLRSSGVYF